MDEKSVVLETDWETSPMPKKHVEFKIKRHFTDEEMACLRFGHIPQEMEDKWFWYMKENKLYAHRSWTGICIYVLTFHEGKDTIDVTVNSDPSQYSCDSKKEEAGTILSLLNWWCCENYDYYHEWIEETLKALKKSHGDK